LTFVCSIIFVSFCVFSWPTYSFSALTLACAASRSVAKILACRWRDHSFFFILFSLHASGVLLYVSSLPLRPHRATCAQKSIKSAGGYEQKSENLKFYKSLPSVKSARKACRQVLAIANRFFEAVARINEGPLKENQGDFGGNRGIFEENRGIYGLNQDTSSANNGDPDHEPKNEKRNQFSKGKNEHKLRFNKDLRKRSPPLNRKNEPNLKRASKRRMYSEGRWTKDEKMSNETNFRRS